MNKEKLYPKLLGFVFLIVIAFSLFGGLMSDGAIGKGNIDDMMVNGATNSNILFFGILGNLFTSILIVLLATLLYITLRDQNKVVATWAFGLWIIEALFIAITTLFTFSFLNLSKEFVNSNLSNLSYLTSIGSLLHNLMQYSYYLHMVFYCIGGLLFYYLLFKSKYIPRAIPLFGIIAVFVGLIGELFSLSGHIVPIYVFIPILPFELLIGVWLIINGFNCRK